MLAIEKRLVSSRAFDFDGNSKVDFLRLGHNG
jgi:hypothetical protein